MLLQNVLRLGHRGEQAGVREPDAAADLRRRHPGCGGAVEDRMELWRQMMGRGERELDREEKV